MGSKNPVQVKMKMLVLPKRRSVAIKVIRVNRRENEGSGDQFHVWDKTRQAKEES
jgi:hypothetical protein